MKLRDLVAKQLRSKRQHYIDELGFHKKRFDHFVEEALPLMAEETQAWGHAYGKAVELSLRGEINNFYHALAKVLRRQGKKVPIGSWDHKHYQMVKDIQEKYCIPLSLPSSFHSGGLRTFPVMPNSTRLQQLQIISAALVEILENIKMAKKHKQQVIMAYATTKRHLDEPLDAT